LPESRFDFDLTSALLPKADIADRKWHVRRRLARASTGSSLAGARSCYQSKESAEEKVHHHDGQNNQQKDGEQGVAQAYIDDASQAAGEDPGQTDAIQ
jgi:hypothetical protein